MKSLTQQFKSAVNQSMKAGIDYLKQKVDEKTPIDTWNLIKNTKIRVRWLIWEVYNDTEYAPYVEYGVKSQTYNYHKGGRVYYSGVWARMMSRTADEEEKNVAKIVEDIITKSIK